MKCDFDINKLKFDEKGLIPAIVTDNITKDVLTLAYMNRESLEKSIEKGLTCFWSRSRNTLWTKGETSGNYQHIVIDYSRLRLRRVKSYCGKGWSCVPYRYGKLLYQHGLSR